MRKIQFDGHWYYILLDVVQELSGTNDPEGYLQRLKDQHKDIDWGELTVPLPMPGKQIHEFVNDDGIELLRRVIPKPLEDLSDFNKNLKKALDFNPKKID